MTKAQIHFSNDLSELIQILKENLFPKESSPFEQRLIAVPHLRLKSFLMQTLAKDPELQVAAGVEIVNLAQAWTKITKKNLPTIMELSLFLQHTLLPMIDSEPELQQYFGIEARKLRIGPFCDALAQYFQRYAIYGKKDLKGWQEKLWKKVTKRWTFPRDLKGIDSKKQLHLFGFTFIPASYFSFFQELGAKMYLFSPCEIFWGDFYSEKERYALKKTVPAHQIDFFEQTFDGQNPFLANWGRVGRKMLDHAEESNIPTQEHYIYPKGNSCLHILQTDCLQGQNSKPALDSSIQCYSASNLHREIEILKDQLLTLMDKQNIQPGDIQVLSPDISLYASYIHAIFHDIPYGITDLGFRQTDEVAKGFALLIELPKKRFALEHVLQLFGMFPFKSKFDLNVDLIRKWLELAHIQWGFSRSQRRSLYLQEIEETELFENTDNGTWEKGLKRLLLGLAQLEGEGAPLCAIEVTEMEQFNQLFCLICSLADDLTPLLDGTKWTIPTWLRYFACLLESYFSLDSTHDLYKQLQQLAASCDHLDQEEISFTSIERVLSQILNQKTKMDQTSQLQAIHFGSLSAGSIQPSKVICLIGMQEEAFPHREEDNSLYAGQLDYRPKRGDEDRYLFLQAMLSAKESFLMSYVRDKEGKWGVSSLVQELLSHLEISVVHHPAHSFDSQYFDGTFFSYNQEQFVVAKAKRSSMCQSPFFKEFYEPTILQAPPIEEREIDVQKLFKFARHPLRYYFHEILGICPESSFSTQSEYLLDPLTKYHLVREALITPVDTVLENAEKRGELPINLLKPLAKEQFHKEIELWTTAMKTFGIKKDELNTKKVDLQVGPYHLVGKLELCTTKGMLVKGKDCLEDRMRFYPQALILQSLGLPLLPIKEQEPLIIEGSLEEYLDYFNLASKHPSPFLPKLAKAFLMGTEADLQKGFKQIDDEIWQWLLFRDGYPNASVIYRNWSKYLRGQFAGCVDAKV